MLNLNGDNSYVSLLIYCTRATGYFLQQINSGDERAWGGFCWDFCSFYQKYVACIDGFVTYELWSHTGGRLCAISVAGAVLGFTDKQGKAWSSNYTVETVLYETAFLTVTNGCF